MAVKHMDYRAIPVEQREKTAAHASAAMKQRLLDRTLTPEQRSAILTQLDRLARWADGTLPVHGS